MCGGVAIGEYSVEKMCGPRANSLNAQARACHSVATQAFCRGNDGSEGSAENSASDNPHRLSRFWENDFAQSHSWEQAFEIAIMLP